jgi:hypothetical protein
MKERTIMGVRKVPTCSACGYPHHSYEDHVDATYVDPWGDPTVNIDSKWAHRG